MLIANSPKSSEITICLNVANGFTYFLQDLKLQSGKLRYGGSHFPGEGGDCSNSAAAFPSLIPTKPQKAKWTEIFRNFSFSTPHKRENCQTERQFFPL